MFFGFVKFINVSVLIHIFEANLIDFSSLVEQPPSSSSISTTTTSSEVTSLASFEQEDRANDSASDYEENWEADNWGDIQVSNSLSWLKVGVLSSFLCLSLRYRLMIN